MTTEKQAHWRKLQTLRKYFKSKKENSVARTEDYAQQINDIEGKLGSSPVGPAFRVRNLPSYREKNRFVMVEGQRRRTSKYARLLEEDRPSRPGSRTS